MENLYLTEMPYFNCPHVREAQEDLFFTGTSLIKRSDDDPETERLVKLSTQKVPEKLLSFARMNCKISQSPSEFLNQKVANSWFLVVEKLPSGGFKACGYIQSINPKDIGLSQDTKTHEDPSFYYYNYMENIRKHYNTLIESAIPF